jgi:hypothetical protein
LGIDEHPLRDLARSAVSGYNATIALGIAPMSDDSTIQKALERISILEAQIAELQPELTRLKNFVNEGDRLNGREPRFANVDVVQGSSVETPITRVRVWKPGAFFEKPLATAVKAILTARAGDEGGPFPLSVDDIHTALSQGSFAFGTSGIDNQKNSIRISLGKNSTVFAKLPNSDLFGLAEWYRKKRGGIRPMTRLSPSPEGEAADGDTSADD